MDWVEVKGRDVDLAVEVALQELGLESREHADIQVIQEPEKGFLGIGSREAIVRVKQKPPPRRRRRGRQRSRPRKSSGDRRRQSGSQAQKAKPKDRAPVKEPEPENEEPSVSVEEQAQVVKEFLTGMLEAFGLEGSVETQIEDEVIIVDVVGEQTEALIGARGSIMQALHELTRTVVQRKTKRGARIRLDVAGYAARRREALAIYAARLAEQVRDDGQEIILEPMSPGDRKVIHDALSEVDGVRTYSEGEEPRRSVIVAPSEAVSGE